MIVLRSDSGETHVRRHATWGMYVEWNLDGTLAKIPQRWDFPDIKDKDFSLPQVKVGVWGGFVFVNRDPDCVPLEAYLGHLIEHFQGWDRGEVYLEATIRKTVLANWKICIEGFLEAYHISGVHPQALPFGGDSSAQYDVWPDDPNVNRFLQPLAFQSDQYPREVSQQEVLDSAVNTVFGPGHQFTLAPGQTARQFLTQAICEAASAADGKDYSGYSDTEITDAMQYMLFPNFIVFRSLPYPLAYRFLPVPGDPDKATFDLMVFKPKLPGKPVPEAKYFEIDAGTSFAEANVLPAWLAQIYDQDSDAFPFVQEGLRDGGDADVVYSAYQEVRIRHLHHTLTSYVDRPASA